MVAVTVVGAIAVVLCAVGTRFVCVRRVAPTDREAFAHRWLAADARATEGTGPPVRPTVALTRGAYCRPFLTAWLVAAFPSAWEPAFDRHLGEVADIGTALVGAGTAFATGAGPTGAVVAAGLILVSPQSVRPDRRDSRGLGTRKVGLVLAAAGLAVTNRWLVGGSTTLAACAVVCGALVVLTDRVALQASAFVVFGHTALLDPLVAVVAGGAAGIAVLLSGGRVARTLLAHLVAVRDALGGRGAYLAERRGPGTETPVWRTVLTAASNAPAPVVVGLVTLAAATGAVGDGPVVSPSLAVWLGAGLGLAVIALHPRAALLGTPDAYLEFATVPAALLVARWWETFTPAVGVVVVLAVGSVLVTLTAAYRTEPVDQWSTCRSWRGIVSALQERSTGGLVVQPADRARALAWETDHLVVDTVGNEEATGRQRDLLFPDAHRYVTGDARVLRYYFDPDWVVFDRSRSPQADEDVLSPPDADPAYVNGRYELYGFDALVPDDPSVD